MEVFSAPFIKTSAFFDPEDQNYSPSPLFRRRFTVDRKGKAILRFCGLGYGYCYINGQAVTEDVLTAPVSEYDKLVWYCEYDVTDLIQPGDNLIAVILGNGFFNESFDSVWDHNKACWRDQPKLAMELHIDGEKVLESDTNFLCSNQSFVTYNHLRSGETFDARLYDSNWKQINYDDSDFSPACIDDRMDLVERRLCPCEPIRECEVFDFTSCLSTPEGYVLDFGSNISGYIRMQTDAPAGTVITLHHAEEIFPDGRLKLNNLDILYPTVDFQVDRYICGDQKHSWSPKFTYHGFRFVLIKGLPHEPKPEEFKAVFVHQDVRRMADFECSDSLVNKIYQAGIRSTYSNLHYALTDCPTREKLGWTNDAQASLEQIYINFDIRRFMSKWGYDFLIAMREDGNFPAIVPSHGWGFKHGPVADGAFFQLPYLDYLYSGDRSLLLSFLPKMELHYDAFIKGTIGENYHLGDWNGHISFMHDNHFLKLFFTVKYARIIALAYQVKGQAIPERYILEEKEALTSLLMEYIGDDGRCIVANKCMIAMLIYLKPDQVFTLVQQLKALIIADNYAINYGMLCIQYIYEALSENGEADTAWKLITSRDELSYSAWFEQGATSLWETFEMGHTDSRNHHMLSAILAWFFKAILGISPSTPGYREIYLHPNFIGDLQFCRGYVETPYGKVEISWERTENGITYTAVIPEGIEAYMDSRKLHSGINIMQL